MPRLFTGLEIPPDIASQLALFRGGLPGARLVETADYHLTLRFIGDIDTPTANEIAEELETIQPRTVSVSLERLDVFGKDRPHSLIVQAARSEALNALQAEHERLIRRIGAPPEPRKFTPHVSLARLRNVSPEAVAAFIGMRGDPRPLRFEVKRFALFSARDSRGGGPYRVEAIYPLDGCPQQDATMFR